MHAMNNAHDRDGSVVSRDEEEVVLDAESDEERELEREEDPSPHALRAQLAKLREELKVVRRERDDHLAGWQRTKADLVNFRRMVEEDKVRDENRVRATFIRALVPSLDSFENAMASKKWTDIDAVWREGVERIATQLHKALSDEGLVSYGAEGDSFDPTLHECMSVVPSTNEHEDHTIGTVLQKGYRIHDEVVRPAKVVVRQCG